MGHKEKLEEAKRLYETANADQKYVLESLFPELRESEDERIRKALIEGFKVMKDGSYGECTFSNYNIPVTDIITWLEKQGDINPTEDELEASRIAAYEPTKNWSEKLQSLYEKLAHCDRGEQKSIEEHDICKFCEDRYGCVSPCPAKLIEKEKSADKFKVGDWVVYCGKTCKITGLHNGIFTITNQDGSYFFNQVKSTMEPVFHHWTIQDAKDGDVICTSSTAINEVSIFKGLTIEGFIECYCSYDSEDEYCERKYHFIGKPTPATEEQRDLLFQKIKENGYEWDAEKKELKKIEQKPTAWGEEDESTINDIICYIRQRLDYESEKGKKKIQKCESWLKSLSGRVQPQPKKDWSEEDEKYTNIVLAALYSPGAEGLYSFHKVKSSDVTNWFISLKDRVRPQSQWKPSDKDIFELQCVINNDPYNDFILKALLEQLKKLKGQ